MSSSNLIEDYSEKEERVNAVKFYWTGHPFVDAGLVAILLIARKNKPEELTEGDIENAIEFASELYATKEWSSGYLHGMIFPNNGILMANPSMGGSRSPEKIAERLEKLYKNISSTMSKDYESRCIICGRQKSACEIPQLSNDVIKSGIIRSVFSLLGTGDVNNFFPSANIKGADVCAHCLFLIEFMPLESYNLSRVLVIHAYPYELMLELSKEAIEDIEKNRLASQAREFRRPENFLFHLVGEVTRKMETGIWESASVTLYYFICNNQNQTLDVIHVPTPVLRFVAYANLVDRKGWKSIVSMGWRSRPSDDEKFEELVRSHRKNDVYSRLLNYESILPYFYNSKEKRVNASWNLLAFYCEEVMGLDKEALDFIKEVGDRIVETIGELPDHKLDDEVRSLERAEKLYQFEAFFIRIEKLRQNLGIETPLMTFDEFARILTAYGEDVNISWRSVKNLLLFRIYEKLHDKLLKKVESEEIGEADTEEGEYAIYGGGEE